MTPVVALVGRPNVGKSTLFNRLTRSRDALVADFPGLTRDRKYGQAKVGEMEFIAVDTGGIDGSEEGIELKMAEQSLLAIEEADVVLFLVDARAGVTPGDRVSADHLRRQQKKVFLVANKTDGIDADLVVGDFYELGLGSEIYQIAAAHGRGVHSLLEQALAPHLEILQGKDEPDEEDEWDDRWDELEELTPEEGEDEDEDAQPFADLPIKFAIVGRPNVGKSTLTNRMLGEDRVIVFDMPGTTRDSIYIPLEKDGEQYIVIDTAGVRKRKKVNEAVEKFSVVKTLQAIEDSNVTLLIIDANAGVTDQDMSLLSFIIQSGRSLVIAVNKWDGLDKEVKDKVKEDLTLRLGFVDFAEIHFISALHGTGVGHLFESIQKAYKSATTRVSTSKLNRILELATQELQPPMSNGRRIRLKYAHAGGYNPPRIIIHGNKTRDITDSYKRYLTNYYRRSLGIIGTPISLEFNESENPFEGKKNKLTQSQIRKRKRLMSFVKKAKSKSKRK